MDLSKLNPWNWFKHEESHHGHTIPVARSERSPHLPTKSAGSLMQLHREMDALFDDVFSAFGMPTVRDQSTENRIGGVELNPFRPAIDIAGNGSHYEISLDVPGMDESDIAIELTGDVLTIKGEKQESSENKDKQFYRVERRYGAFQRTLSLPDDAETDHIKARLQQGVLMLDIPRKKTEAKPARQITIND